jgi:hypothetical protein
MPPSADDGGDQFRKGGEVKTRKGFARGGTVGGFAGDSKRRNPVYAKGR